MKLVALCGAAGAGKDTVADMLPARKLAFADALYREVAEAWGVEQHVLRCRETKETPTGELALFRCADDSFVEDSHFGDHWGIARIPRQILQWWGDYRRAQDPDYFVKQMQPDGDTVITDVRFPNEAALVRQLGGQLWQIRRPGYEAGGTGHASDTDGSEFGPDYVIENDASLEQLKDRVDWCWRVTC